MKDCSLIMISIILLILTGCADKPTETTTLGSVHGNIFDQSNNSGLSGVAVSIQNVGNRTTDNNGYYEFLDLEENIYSINAEKAGYVTETAQVEIEANTNKEMNFTLHSAQPAQLLVSPTNLNFGQTVYDLNITVNNGGDEQLSWQIISDQSWLTTFPSTGTTTTEEDQTTITVNRSGLEVGNYTGNLSFTSNGGDFNVPVQMEVTPIVLIIDPNSLNFGSEETDLSFTISNTGNGELDWSLTPNQSWITADPSSGSLTNNSEDILVTVNRSGLTPNTYDGTISITSNGGNQDVNITMIVPEGPAPILEVDTTTLDFGDNLTTLNFTISNTGDDILNWNISDNQDWINVIPAGGTTNPQNNESISVLVDRTGLSFGSYNGSVSITSDGGNGNVSISMTVEPELVVSTNLLNFGLTSNQLTFNITNNGHGVLTWNISDNQNWITVSPESETTTTETDIIQVNVDRTGLNSGDYSGIITIQSDGGNEQITVNISVPNPPILVINPTSLNFGTTTNQLSFEIQNTGDATLNWNISDNQNWINVYPTSGSTNPSGTTSINISVDRTGLSFGSYNGSVSITSDGGNESVSVSMSVPFFDTFENLNNWSALGWELDTTNWSEWDAPTVACTAITGTNYLSTDINVVSGQMLSFRLKVWDADNDNTSVKLFFNNVLIQEWFKDGAATNWTYEYNPEIQFTTTGMINIKFEGYSEAIPIQQIMRIDDVGIN